MSNTLEATLMNRMGKSKYTWGDLLKALKKCTPEQLKQSVQIFPPHNTPDPVKLMPGIAFDTIEGFEETNSRSADDFKHHPEQLVLLTDHCGFSDYGDTYYTMDFVKKQMVGNVSGKIFDLKGELKKRKKK